MYFLKADKQVIWEEAHHIIFQTNIGQQITSRPYCEEQGKLIADVVERFCVFCWFGSAAEAKNRLSERQVNCSGLRYQVRDRVMNKANIITVDKTPFASFFEL